MIFQERRALMGRVNKVLVELQKHPTELFQKVLTVNVHTYMDKRPGDSWNHMYKYKQIQIILFYIELKTIKH